MNSTIHYLSSISWHIFFVHHTLGNNGRKLYETAHFDQRFPSSISRRSDGLVPDNQCKENNCVKSLRFYRSLCGRWIFVLKEDFLDGEGKVHLLQSLL